MNRWSRLDRRLGRRRGQALAIAALIMLLTFVAVMLTFAIGNRTREKVKLQSIADAGAYSLAVAGARTFNYVAWSNRAHVAHDISILSIHSHQSYLSWYDNMLQAQGTAHFIAAGVMGAMCLACAFSGVCCMSCSNAGKAAKVGRYYRDEVHREFHRDYFTNTSYHDRLHLGAQAHMKLITGIGLAQRLMLGDLTFKAGMQTFADDAARLIDNRVGPAGGAGVASARNINGAIGWHPANAEEWLEINSASRWPQWITQRGYVIEGGHWWLKYARAAQMGIPCAVLPIPPHNSGNAKILGISPQGSEARAHNTIRDAVNRKEPHGRDAWSGFRDGGGHAFGAWDSGGASALWICDCPAPGYMTAKGAAYSDPNDRGHQHGWHLVDGRPVGAHSSHGLGGCDSNRACGIYQGHMRYKMATERSTGGRSGNPYLWHQPHTVAFVTKQANRRREVWDFDFRATLPLPVAFTTTGSLGDSPPMAAIAGGLVYYHKPNGGESDGWREPPSLWNPFWRAKLHPVTPSDARTAFFGHESFGIYSVLGHKALNY